MNAKELLERICKEEEQNHIVIRTFDGDLVFDLDEILKQPTEGLLYDLNRDKATVSSWVADDNPKWVNDYAVAVVIERLHKDRADFLTRLEGVVRELDKMPLGIMNPAEYNAGCLMAREWVMAKIRAAFPELPKEE